MDVVLDTNIVISAAITPKGPPGQIIAAWRTSRFVWITSPPLLQELARAFQYPRVRRYLAWDDGEIAEFLALAGRMANIVEPASALHVVSNDADDNRVLEAAIAGHAQYVVTNDDDLLRLDVYEEIQIVTAARFAALLANLPREGEG